MSEDIEMRLVALEAKNEVSTKETHFLLSVILMATLFCAALLSVQYDLGTPIQAVAGYLFICSMGCVLIYLWHLLAAVIRAYKLKTRN